MTGRRGRRRKQLPDYLRKRGGYCKLKEAVLCSVSSSPKRMSLAKIVTANIHVIRMDRVKQSNPVTGPVVAQRGVEV